MAIRTEGDRSSNSSLVGESRKQNSEARSADPKAASARTQADQVSLSGTPRYSVESRAERIPEAERIRDFDQAASLAKDVEMKSGSSLLAAHGQLDPERVQMLLEGLE